MLMARQPILDLNNEVYGYELLYRDAGSEVYTCDDDNRATAQVIINNFLSYDVKEIFENKKIFINFTEELITNDIATLFSKDELIIEIQEMEQVTQSLLDACKRLKSFEYTLAFGEFVFKKGFEQLVEFADIIKVDFLAVSESEKSSLIKNNKNEHIRFLAEKVETQDEYIKAKEIGYTMFQGYFFAKPSIMSSHHLVPNKKNIIQLLKAIADPNVRLEDLSWIIESDVALSYEILKLVNSAFFSRGKKISSIRQAIVILGINEIRKWSILFSLRSLDESANDEIIKITMIRSRFLEFFSKKINTSQKGSEYMTVGMLSMLDSITHTKMSHVLDTLSLTDEVRDILLMNQVETPLAIAYHIILNIENGSWKEVSRLADLLNVTVKEIADIHFEAIKYVIETIKRLNGGAR